MNETDHALTLCIKKLSNDWEEKSRMRFSGAKPIMQLVGYPLVFFGRKILKDKSQFEKKSHK